MNFSDKIKFQREQNHLTQKELAGLVGVSQCAIAAMKVPAPSHESLL